MYLKINAVVRITEDGLDGLYRIIALPPGSGMAFLFQLAEEKHPKITRKKKPNPKPERLRNLEKFIQVSTEALATYELKGTLKEVTLDVHPKYQLSIDNLSDKERKIFENRCALALPFLDHERVSNALMSTRGIGKLITEIRSSRSSSRSSCYRHWISLCQHGLHQGSLNPRFDRCGAPGKLRLWAEGKPKVGRKTSKERLGIEEEFPQTGVTDEMRQKIICTYKVLKRDPKSKFGTIYIRIVANCFTKSYRETDDGLTAVPPAQGAYPNENQVRRIINQESDRLARKLARTSIGYFNRNHRGLIGKSWEGVAGPGHVYAIDSTIGDIFLRSRVNRAWYIGRPIVYIVVDFWSTAVVGFHVCLSGPSWATAKIALLSTASNAPSLARMWGRKDTPMLSPSPGLPHAFLCDRGEYLSKGAKATGERLGVNMQYNPSYRPDLKGIVEVLHRIAKDEQFQFIPGAIDARRKEIEIRTHPRDGIFTLDEYVCYLNDIFIQYNFFSDRSHRLTTDMMAANVDPSPAGLWSFGHEVGIGYQKHHSASQLITDLLPSQNAFLRKDGVYFGGLPYSSPIVQEKKWSALARNFGVTEQPMHYFPENNQNIWWNNPEKNGIETFDLSPTSPAASGTSFDEWLDARQYDKTKESDRRHNRIVSSLRQQERTEALVARAKEATVQADRAYQGPPPNLRDAKSFETYPLQEPSPTENLTSAPNIGHENPNVYETAMEELFSAANKEVAP